MSGIANSLVSSFHPQHTIVAYVMAAVACLISLVRERAGRFEHPRGRARCSKLFLTVVSGVVLHQERWLMAATMLL